MWVNIFYRPPGQDLPSHVLRRYTPDNFVYSSGLVLRFDTPVQPEDERIEDVAVTVPPVVMCVEAVVANMRDVADNRTAEALMSGGGMDEMPKVPVPYDVHATNTIVFNASSSPTQAQLEAVGFRSVVLMPDYLRHLM